MQVSWGFGSGAIASQPGSCRGISAIGCGSGPLYSARVRLVRVTAMLLCAAAIGIGLGSVGSSAVAGAESDSWRALLARVPASGTFADSVILNDYAAARAVGDVPRSPDRIHDLLTMEEATGVAPSELFLGQGRGDPLADELGIRSRDVKADLVAGNPPDELTILQGSINPKRVQRAVESDATFSDLLQTTRYHKQRYYTWGLRRVDPRRRTPLRPLGIGGNLAIDPPFATWSDSSRTVEASIDAAAGKADSLADDRDLTAVADALRSRGAYSGFLTAKEVAPGVPTGGPTPLAPYDALGTGPTLQGAGKPDLLVALAYPDAATARAQADRFRAIAEQGTSVIGAPWSDLVAVDEITPDGRVVVGRFRTEKPRLWLDVALRRDSLLASA